MTTTEIEMTEDEFDAAFSLLPNHIDASATWAIDDGPGCLFGISPEELAFVRSQDPSTIWTLLDGDDGDLYVASGYHFVNRIGYLLSTVPVPDEQFIRVHIPMNPEPA